MELQSENRALKKALYEIEKQSGATVSCPHCNMINEIATDALDKLKNK